MTTTVVQLSGGSDEQGNLAVTLHELSDQLGSNIVIQNTSGPEWTFWAILLSATIALCAALFSIGAQRFVAKKRAAIDLILQSETIELIEYPGVFDELIAKKELLTIFSPRNGNDYEKGGKYEICSITTKFSRQQLKLKP